MSVKKFFEFVLFIAGLFFLCLVFLGFGGFFLAYDAHAHFAKDLRFYVYVISTVSLNCGLIGLAELIISEVRKARRAKKINRDIEYQETDAAAERRRLNLFLVIVAILCPFVSFLGSVGSIIACFMSEALTGWWMNGFAFLSMLLFFGAGLVGLASAVAFLIINRKQQKSPLVWCGLLLLLLINFCLSLTILSLPVLMIVSCFRG